MYVGLEERIIAQFYTSISLFTCVLNLICLNLNKLKV